MFGKYGGEEKKKAERGGENRPEYFVQGSTQEGYPRGNASERRRGENGGLTGITPSLMKEPEPGVNPPGEERGGK